MEWYNILLLIFGGIGGTTGVLGFYNAKSNKQTIDISNLTAIIEEERKERVALRKEYDEYKESVDDRIRMFKAEFDKMKQNNLKYLKAVYQAYRCQFPPQSCDCPVIKAIEKRGLCEDCIVEDNE